LAQGGAAVAALVERDLRPILLGAEADRIRHCGSARGGGCITAAAAGLPASPFRPSTPRCGSET